MLASRSRVAHRGSHTLSAEATDAYEGARATVADHLGARDRREVVFVRNATEAINLVARAWGGANVGAGTIFCNYDGFKKHKTTIGKGAFIGSDSQLVAPVTIGDNAYVATGTTVTKDVPTDALAIARVPQENKLGYAPRLKARLGAGTKKT